jgi:hypothetical protein
LTPLAARVRLADKSFMFLKLLALAAAAIPAYLFVRRMFGRRPSRLSEEWREAKKHFDYAIWIFLGLIGCIVAFAVGKLAWTWWSAL